MSLVDVLPGRAGDADHACRPQPAAHLGRRSAPSASTAVGHDDRWTRAPASPGSRRRTAAAPAAQRVGGEVGRRRARSPGRATNRSPGATARESIATPRHGRVPAGRRAARDGGDLARRERDHAARRAPRAPRGPPSRSSNGIVPVGQLLAVLVALAGDDDDVARLARRPTARSIAAPAVDLDAPIARCRRVISAMMAVGILAARVVGRDDGDVGQAPRDRAHQRALAAVAIAAAAEDADQPARR